MANDTTSANTLIQDQVSNMLIQPLEAKSVVLAAGPTVFNSSEPLRIPTITAGFDPAWVGENGLIPEDEAAFGEIQLMPTERKSIKVITRVSNELIRQASVGVSSVLQQRLVADVATKLDTALLTGDGLDNTVTGLINQAAITKTAHDVVDPDSYLDALALAASKEVTPNRLIVNGGDFFSLRKIKDADGRYLIQETLQEDVKYSLFGIPVTVTNKIPAGKAVLADMSQVAVVRDIDPQVKILTERYAEYDQVGIRVTTRYDLGLLNAEGVILMDTAAV